MPEEYHCHLRCTIRKEFSQPECPRTDVFYVDPKGDYLPTVVEATRLGIATEGLAWFRRFSEMEESTQRSHGRNGDERRYSATFLRTLWLVCTSKVYSGLGADIVYGIITVIDNGFGCDGRVTSVTWK